MYSAYFSEVVLFADCCRNAYRELPVRSFPLPEIDAPASGRIPYVRGYAVQYRQSAMELKDRPHGVFTSALVDALRNARQPDGRITARSVEAYLHNHGELKRWRNVQEPSFISEGEVVFSRRRAPGRSPATRVRLRLPAGALPVIEGGSPPGTWPVRRGKRAGEYLAELPRGIYAARVPGRRPEYFEVTGEAGGIVDVPRAA
jgi:hypothetical protein